MTAGPKTHPATRATAALAAAFALAALATVRAPAAAQLTTPEEQFGYRLGTDYQLVNYQGLTRLLAPAGGAVGPHDAGVDRQDLGGA